METQYVGKKNMFPVYANLTKNCVVVFQSMETPQIKLSPASHIEQKTRTYC